MNDIGEGGVLNNAANLLVPRVVKGSLRREAGEKIIEPRGTGVDHQGGEGINMTEREG
jgi:hypothetical protein